MNHRTDNIDKVCDEVKSLYEQAKDNHNVIDPVCYALWEVWRKYDTLRKGHAR